MHRWLEVGGIAKVLAGTVIAGLMQSLWGDPQQALFMYLNFVLLDYATGVIAAMITRTTSSKLSKAGILRKLQGLLALGLGHAIDVWLGVPHHACQTGIALMLCGTEIISVYENLKRSGTKMPRWVLDLGKRLASTESDPTQPETQPVTEPPAEPKG